MCLGVEIKFTCKVPGIYSSSDGQIFEIVHTYSVFNLLELFAKKLPIKSITDIEAFRIKLRNKKIIQCARRYNEFEEIFVKYYWVTLTRNTKRYKFISKMQGFDKCDGIFEIGNIETVSREVGTRLNR